MNLNIVQSVQCIIRKSNKVSPRC